MKTETSQLFPKTDPDDERRECGGVRRHPSRGPVELLH